MIDSLGLCFGPAGHLPDHPPPPGLEGVAAEFPTVALTVASPAAPPVGAGTAREVALTIDTDCWCAGQVDFYHLDARVDALAEAGQVRLRVVGARAPQAVPHPIVDTALGLLTRCQRWVGRRNAASRGPGFDRILALHRRLHDISKPLVRADYAHALDVWQWSLRLRPEAGAAVQIAALFHDVERLVSEADERIEHRIAARDAAYDAFKQAHARGGAQMTHALLGSAGVDEALRARVTHLIAGHDRPGPGAPDPDLALLEDADGLSFFSLNSAGFLDYYGPEHTRRKIAWTLARMSAEARARLRRVRLRPDVARLAAEVAA